MKKTLLLLTTRLIINSLYGQEVSVGARAGASIWTNSSYGSGGREGVVSAGPIREQEVFIRYQLPKGFLVEMSGGGHKLEKHNSWSMYDMVSTSRYRVNNKELRLSAQYNYVRLFEKKMKLYLGHSFSAILCNFTEERTNIVRSHGPFLPYERYEGSFGYYAIGLNHTITYRIHKNIALHNTFSLRNDISSVAIPDMWFGDISVSGLLGLSYTFVP